MEKKLHLMIYQQAVKNLLMLDQDYLLYFTSAKAYQERYFANDVLRILSLIHVRPAKSHHINNWFEIIYFIVLNPQVPHPSHTCRVNRIQRG